MHLITYYSILHLCAALPVRTAEHVRLSAADLVCLSGDKDESTNSWFNFPRVLERKAVLTSWQITWWLLETGIQVSGRRDTLHLDSPVPLMLGNQTFPREAIKLDTSFSIIYCWEHFPAALNGWKWLSRLQRNKESGPAGSLQGNEQDNPAVSALPGTARHSGGCRAGMGASDWATLPWEVTHPDGTTGNRGRFFAERKKNYLLRFLWGKGGKAVCLHVGFYFISILPAGSLRE